MDAESWRTELPRSFPKQLLALQFIDDVFKKHGDIASDSIGLFAQEDIPEGEVIIEYTGQVGGVRGGRERGREGTKCVCACALVRARAVSLT